MSRILTEDSFDEELERKGDDLSSINHLTSWTFSSSHGNIVFVKENISSLGSSNYAIPHSVIHPFPFQYDSSNDYINPSISISISISVRISPARNWTLQTYDCSLHQTISSIIAHLARPVLCPSC